MVKMSKCIWAKYLKASPCTEPCLKSYTGSAYKSTLKIYTIFSTFHSEIDHSVNEWFELRASACNLGLTVEVSRPMTISVPVSTNEPL